MRANIEDIQARRVRQSSGSFGISVWVMTGTYILASDGPTVHFLDPNGITRNVFLPAIAPFGGQYYVVSNIGATGILNVVTAGGAAVATLRPGVTGIFFSRPAGWRSLIDAGALSTLMDEPTIVTASPYTVTNETTIAISRAAPAATDINLPPVAGRSAPLTVVDWSTGVTGHTITVTPNGAETVMGLAAWPIFSNAASLGFATFWPSTTLNGWFMR